MARFGKEEGTKKRAEKRMHGHNRSGFFTRTLTSPALVKGEGKVRGSEASLVNYGVIAECATQRGSAWGDRDPPPPSPATRHLSLHLNAEA